MMLKNKKMQRGVSDERKAKRSIIYSNFKNIWNLVFSSYYIYLKLEVNKRTKIHTKKN